MRKQQSFKVLVAYPHGFCRGVETAVQILTIVRQLYPDGLIYAKNAIVHNEVVTKIFEHKGVKFVEKVNNIPRGSVAVFSAHGSPPSDYKEARARNIQVIDATCRLVVNVHSWASLFASQGYYVLVIGHRGHPEPRGILGHIPEGRGVLIETVEDAWNVQVPDPDKVAAVTQTTLALDEVREIRAVLRERFPKLKEPAAPNSTVCYATTNRQAAVKALAKIAGLILVIGSDKSSNTLRLCEVAERKGAKVELIKGPCQIDLALISDYRIVGLTSGASAPEFLLRETIEKLIQLGASKVELLEIVKEEVPPFTFLPDTQEKLEARARELGQNLADFREVASLQWQ